MTMNHQVIKGKNLIMSTANGKYDDSSLLRESAAVYDLPDWSPVKDRLIDLSQANLEEVTVDGVQKVADLVSEKTLQPVKNRTAIVINPRFRELLLAYRDCSEIQPDLVQPFSDIFTAVEWLKLDGILSA